MRFATEEDPHDRRAPYRGGWEKNLKRRGRERAKQGRSSGRKESRPGDSVSKYRTKVQRTVINDEQTSQRQRILLEGL